MKTIPPPDDGKPVISGGLLITCLVIACIWIVAGLIIIFVL